MGYRLGVDLGTSYTAAALSRDERPDLVSLGTRALEIPTVAYLDPDQGMLIGEAAERRGLTEPTRVAREFKRRLGDPAPILIGGTPYSAEALMAAVLRNVLVEVTHRPGEPPTHVTLTRPANWGPYKRELFDHVPVLADAGLISTTSEPEAAAAHFASTTRVAPGGIIAVYDLGGGTFDAAVLRKTDDGFEILGVPEGIEHLGGADFDDAVFDHVRRVLGSTLTDLNPFDPAVRGAAARLRAECVQAKEHLSRDIETVVHVSLPGIQTEVRLTRAEFEDLIRPSLMATIESLRRALRSAKVAPDQVVATVLAGGSSRIPLVAELIGSELQLPVAVGTHPKHAVALGAALSARTQSICPAGRSVIEAGATNTAETLSDQPAPTGTLIRISRMQIVRRTLGGNPRRRRITAGAALGAAVAAVLAATLAAGGAAPRSLAETVPIPTTNHTRALPPGSPTGSRGTLPQSTRGATTTSADARTSASRRAQSAGWPAPVGGTSTMPRRANPTGTAATAATTGPNVHCAHCAGPGQSSVAVRDTGENVANASPNASSVRATPPLQRVTQPRSGATATSIGATPPLQRATQPRTGTTSTGPAPGSGSAGGGPTAGGIVTHPISAGQDTSRVRIPDAGMIVGHTVSQATAVLTAVGLQVATQTQVSTAPTGQVVGMDPAGGSTVPVGSTVNLMVSRGPAQSTVPSSSVIVGRSVAEATAVLNAAGLHVATETQASTAPTGQVLGMNPAGGSTVAAGSTITLTISDNSLMTAPDLTGLTPSGAIGALQNKGWTGTSLTQDSEPDSNQSHWGTVQRQSPAANTLVSKNSPIAVVVAAQATFSIPALIGLSPDQARATLRSHGWTGSLTSKLARIPSDELAGLIAGQNPAAGSQVGMTVPVTVLLYPPE